MYTYHATLDRVVDGDTIDALIDLGFNTLKKVRIRMMGMDAWESRTRNKEEKKKGLAAKARLIEILEENENKFILVSHGVGKYGRCLGEIYVENTLHSNNPNTPEISVNRILINEGHAKEYYGGKR
jgi:micrococcal nuclease|tara:strand:- start:680 stop:1057 length:378 start_codon:yes stop_codon:yes gene_type:complete